MSGEVKVPLDCRLQLVADMVPEGSRAVDVGCDHAHLSIALIRSGRVASVIASDLRPGPLLSAKENVSRAGLADRIQLRLCDGLDGIAPGEADCVVMAGMGGILITGIIQRAGWLRDPAVSLVLQPMSDAYLVREMLWQSGFELEEEKAAVANRRVYSVLRARYTGKSKQPSPAECYAGLLPRGGQTERLRLEREIRSLRVQIEGVLASGREEERLKELQEICGELEEIVESMKG